MRSWNDAGERTRTKYEESRPGRRLSPVSEAVQLFNLDSLEQRDVQLFTEKLNRWIREWKHRESRRREGWHGGARG